MATVYGKEQQAGMAVPHSILVHEGPTWYTVYIHREHMRNVKTVIRNEKVAYQLLSDSDGEVISILPLPHRSYQKLKTGNLELPLGRGKKKVEFRVLPKHWE